MDKLPEKIYAYKANDAKYRMYSPMADAWDGDSIEYVRSDLVEQEVQALKAMVNDLREGIYAQDKYHTEFYGHQSGMMASLKEIADKLPQQSLASHDAGIEEETKLKVISSLAAHVNFKGNSHLDFVEVQDVIRNMSRKHQLPTNEDQTGSNGDKQ